MLDCIGSAQREIIEQPDLAGTLGQQNISDM